MADLYRRITDQILAQLETARPGDWTCPWHRRGAGLPQNACTGRAYRGINTLALWCAAQCFNFGDDRWATYRQWAQLGAQVRKGERGTLVVFHKESERNETSDEATQGGPRFIARASFVFNVAQVDGAPPLPEPDLRELPPAPAFEEFVANTGATIRQGSKTACYVPAIDEIRVPDRDLFRSLDGYCSVLAHELIHWTGAKSRLDRNLSGRFRTRAYAAEEFVAELGAAFVLAQLGLANEPHPSHAEYIASWITLLREDSRALLTAASLASRAAQYLIPDDGRAAEASSSFHRPEPEPVRRQPRTWTRGSHAHSHGW